MDKSNKYYTKIVLPYHLQEIIKKDKKVEIKVNDKSTKVNKEIEKQRIDDFLNLFEINHK